MLKEPEELKVSGSLTAEIFAYTTKTIEDTYEFWEEGLAAQELQRVKFYFDCLAVEKRHHRVAPIDLRSIPVEHREVALRDAEKAALVRLAATDFRPPTARHTYLLLWRILPYAGLFPRYVETIQFRLVAMEAAEAAQLVIEHVLAKNPTR